MSDCSANNDLALAGGPPLTGNAPVPDHGLTVAAVSFEVGELQRRRCDTTIPADSSSAEAP
jgi:hypothetical protein